MQKCCTLCYKRLLKLHFSDISRSLLLCPLIYFMLLNISFWLLVILNFQSRQAFKGLALSREQSHEFFTLNTFLDGYNDLGRMLYFCFYLLGANLLGSNDRPSCGVTVPFGLKMVCASCVTAASVNAQKMNFQNLLRGPCSRALHLTVLCVKRESGRGLLTGR